MGHRVFLAGASGAVGRPLVRLLVGAGHRVVGTTRTEQGAAALRALGAEPAVVDALDAAAVRLAVMRAAPAIVIHQLTGLAGLRDGRVAQAIALNAEIRAVGTRNLVAAALAAGAARLVAQSIAWIYAPGPLPHAESDPLDLAAEGARGVTVRGVVALESAVLGAASLAGVVLRYGQFFGPGTGRDQPQGEAPVHVEAAAQAALLAMDRGDGGSVFNVAAPNGLVATGRARAVLGWEAGFRLPGGGG